MLQGSHLLTPETSETLQLLHIAVTSVQPSTPPPLLAQPAPPIPMAAAAPALNKALKGNAPVIFDGN